MMEGKKRVVVVVGPGRSGTSAITRGLKVLGIDLGDNLMPALAGVNDKGFWEDQDIYNINLEVFEALDKEWHNLTALDISGAATSILRPLHSKAFEVLRGKFKDTSCFGIKDPQMTRLLPFWQDVFADFDLAVSYVITCRSPNGVVPSLQRYTGFDDSKCFRLWFEYTLASLIHTTGSDRVVVDYDLMMADPAIQLRRIADKLDFDFDVESEEFLAYRDEFLDDSLRHITSDRATDEFELASISRVAPLFDFIQDVATDARDIDSSEAMRFIEGLADAHRQPLVQLENALCELKSSRATLVESRSSFNSLAAELKIRSHALSMAGNALELGTSELVEAREMLVQRTSVAEALRQELMARDEALATARASLSDMAGNFNKLSEDHDERIMELVENRALLVERTGAAEKLIHDLTQQAEELISVRADLAERAENSKRITEDLKQRTSELVEVRELLGERTALAEVLDVDLKRRTDELVDMRALLVERSEQFDELSGRLVECTNDLVLVRGILTARTVLAQKLDEQLIERTEDLVGARRDFAEATTRGNELDVELSQRAERVKMLAIECEKKDLLLQLANAELVRLSQGFFRKWWHHLWGR